jgi:hypothetical protein
MKEILPGLYHWTAFHEGIGMDVSSYYMADSRALLDPMLPAEGIDWFRSREPEVILLTNRHHYRKSDAFREAFGCRVRCHQSGLHEFEGGPHVEGFSFGDEVAPGIVALEMNAICPDDSVLGIEVGEGALAFADALVHWREGEVGFVPDRFMDDPEATKRGIRASARRLMGQGFDTLLFAHGDPIVGGGREALEAFLAG